MADHVYEPWPELDYDQWADTLETVHMWTQIAGKTKLANSPFRNQLWQVGFSLTPVGLTSAPDGLAARRSSRSTSTSSITICSSGRRRD